MKLPCDRLCMSNAIQGAQAPTPQALAIKQPSKEKMLQWLKQQLDQWQMLKRKEEHKQNLQLYHLATLLKHQVLKRLLEQGLLGKLQIDHLGN